MSSGSGTASSFYGTLSVALDPNTPSEVVRRSALSDAQAPAFRIVSSAPLVSAHSIIPILVRIFIVGGRHPAQSSASRY
jgi:hypothetical protein